MGAWSLLIAFGLLLAFAGLFTHWSLILLGALVPVIPVVAELVKRRRQSRD